MSVADSSCIAPFRKGDGAPYTNYPKCQDVNKECGGCDSVCARRAGKKGRRDYSYQKERKTNGVECEIICDGWPSRGCKVFYVCWNSFNRPSNDVILDQGNSKGHMVLGILHSSFQLPGQDTQTISKMQAFHNIFLQTM